MQIIKRPDPQLLKMNFRNNSEKLNGSNEKYIFYGASVKGPKALLLSSYLRGSLFGSVHGPEMYQIYEYFPPVPIQTVKIVKISNFSDYRLSLNVWR